MSPTYGGSNHGARSLGGTIANSPGSMPISIRVELWRGVNSPAGRTSIKHSILGETKQTSKFTRQGRFQAAAGAGPSRLCRSPKGRLRQAASVPVGALAFLLLAVISIILSIFYVALVFAPPRSSCRLRPPPPLATSGATTRRSQRSRDRRAA